MHVGWKLLSKKLVYDHPWRSIEEWVMQRPDGSEGVYSIQLSRGDVVVVFGITADNHVLLLRQYYIAHQSKVPTLVAGFVEEGSPQETARHELQEEAGCVAADWVYLGDSFRGKYNTGLVRYYLATGVVERGGQQLEPSEDIDVSFVSVDVFKKLLREGGLQDVFQVACAYRALDHLGLLS